MFGFESENDLSEPDKNENKDKILLQVTETIFFTISELIPGTTIPKELYPSPSLKQSVAE